MVDVAPSTRDMTRSYMLAELAVRGITMSWTSKVPEVRPERFATIEELNAADLEMYADSQLLQIRLYDVDAKRCADTSRLVKALWKVMPGAYVEMAGGPTDQDDPDVVGLKRYVLTAWVTAMLQPE